MVEKCALLVFGAMCLAGCENLPPEVVKAKEDAWERKRMAPIERNMPKGCVIKFVGETAGDRIYVAICDGVVTINAAHSRLVGKIAKRETTVTASLPHD